MKEKGTHKKEKTPRFHMEAFGNSLGASMLVYGVRHIEDLSEQKILLRVAGGRICVLGSVLTVAVFENKTVEIGGKIQEVKLIYEKS